MVKKNELKVTGTRELFRNLDKIEKYVNKHLDDIIRKAAKVIKRDMKARAPIRSGTLQENIEIEVKEVKILQNSIRVGIGPVGDDPFYWYFIEKGTYKMEAQPFVRPAFDDNDKKVKKMIENGIENLLRKVRLY